jgi:hypothetical protein
VKRFTETNKWDDPWFLELSMEHKLLWQWLCDRCDNAGIIEPSMKLASFHIGHQYPSDTLSAFGDRLVKIGGGKWFIPKFIAFQYGKLSSDCKAHNPVFVSLEKNGIDVENLTFKGYSKGIHTLKEKEKEKVTEKEPEKSPLILSLSIDDSPEAAKKPKPNATPEMVRIGKIMGRRESTKWSRQEIQAFKDADFVEEEIRIVEDFYRFEERSNDQLFRRTGLLSLLNHWPDEVSKAHKWAKKYGRPITGPYNPTGK